MDITIAGLPLHPLVVHFVVVLLPLAAILVATAAVSPRFRAWAGWLPLAASTLALILTPVTTSSGEALEEGLKRPGTDMKLVEQHAELGDRATLVAIAVFVAAVLVWFVNRPGKEAGKPIRISVSVIAVLVAIGTIVMITLIGHSGAEAAWHASLAG